MLFRITGIEGLQTPPPANGSRFRPQPWAAVWFGTDYHVGSAEPRYDVIVYYWPSPRLARAGTVVVVVWPFTFCF